MLRFTRTCSTFFINVWQAVREIYEIVPTRDWKKEENQMNKIVFIGKWLCSLLTIVHKQLHFSLLIWLSAF